MKKLALSAIVFFCSLALSYAQDDIQRATAEAAAAFLGAPEAKPEAQKPDYWSHSLGIDLGFSQTGLTSWAAGGYNTVSLNSAIDTKANYVKDLKTWNNRLQLQYGFLWSADKQNILQSSTDLIYLESQFAYSTGKNSKWNYTVSFDFRSQFTNIYSSYVQDSETGLWSGTLNSGFLAPAYTNIAVGMQWAPKTWFSINIAPLTGGFTICTIEELRSTYGMKLRSDDLDDSIGANYRSALFQMGAQIKVDFQTSINDNLSYETQLVLFTDYLSSPFMENRINWDNKISFQFSRFFKVALNTWLIYDPIVLVNGEQKVQFKESFSINFSWLISSK